MITQRNTCIKLFAANILKNNKFSDENPDLTFGT